MFLSLRFLFLESFIILSVFLVLDVLFKRRVNRTVEKLYSVFKKDRDRWWSKDSQREHLHIPKFIYRAALKQIDHESGLEEKAIPIRGLWRENDDGTIGPVQLIFIRLRRDSPRPIKAKSKTKTLHFATWSPQ